MPDKGHGDHANREVHRPLAVVSPLLTGPDIKALQEADNNFLHDHKLHGHLAEDGDFGERTAEVTDHVAYALGLESAGETPHHIGRVFSQDEQHLIRDPSKRTDAQKERSARRVKQLQEKEKADQEPGGLRAKILDYALWGVANTASIHYQQSRPFPIDHPRVLPMYTDCSGFVTLAYEDAGAPNPNGATPRGFGYTGTLLTGSRHIAKAEALPADMCVYGSYPGMHVVLLKEPGSVADPLTISHGQEAGPLLVRHSAEVSAHGGAPVTFLRAL